MRAKLLVVPLLLLGLSTNLAFGQANDLVCNNCVHASDMAAKAITTNKLGNSAVVTDKIQAGAITTNKIGDGAVSRSKLRAGAVTTGKIQDGAVTAAKLAPDALYPPIGGDGSAGDLVISNAVNWNSVPPANPNFANITIEVAGILTVPAGTTIGCSGNFVNNGQLTVLGGAANNGTSFSTNTGPTLGYSSAAHPGDTPRPANASDWHNDSIADTEFLTPGAGGFGIPQATVITSLKRFRFGGGSGGGVLSGATGGGLIIVKCAGAVTNTGSMTADGSQGQVATGGGGGGIVVLASSTTVDNSAGTINARGATGGAENTTCCAPGGGGGGGIVVSIAPNINNGGGVIDVSGGAGVTAVGVPGLVSRTAGGGGGGSGGNGGTGGSGGVNNGNSGTGTVGYSLEIFINPATIL